MLERLFPRVIDNTYRGAWIAIWLLVLILLMKLAIAGGSIFNSRQAAGDADGIPLGLLGAQGVEIVISLFVLLALAQLTLALLGVIALIRYRGMISLVYLLLLIEQAGRRLLSAAHPMPRIDTSGAGLPIGTIINLAILGAMILGFGLSLMRRHGAPGPA